MVVQLVFGDLSHSVLDSLEKMVKDVYGPLLCTPKHVRTTARTPTAHLSS